MASSIFPTANTVTPIETATGGALSGDGSSGNKLAVTVDGSTIGVNGSDQLEVIEDYAIISATGSQILYRAGATDAGGVSGSSVSGSQVNLTSVGVGTAPYAASGAVRLGSGDAVASRNATDDADVALVRVLTLAGSTYAVLGDANFGSAALGSLSLPNNQTLNFINATNDGTLQAIYAGVDNGLEYGNGSSPFLSYGSNSWDGNSGALFFGRDLTETAADQTWVGDGNNPLFVVSAGNTIYSGSADTFLGLRFALRNGGSLQTDTTTGHTATLSAYDVNAAAYVALATLTNGNAPSLVIAPSGDGTVSVQGAYKSNDGTAGVTAGPFTVITGITVKNGIVTALAGS